MQRVIFELHSRRHVGGPCMPIEGGFRGKRAYHEAGRDRVLKIFILAGPHGLLEEG